MFKWTLALVGALTISVFSGAVLLANQSFNVSATEAARKSRITLQTAQQRSELLKMAKKEKILSSLELDLDSFNVKLALAIASISDRENSLPLQFEQETIGKFVYPDSDMEIDVIALKLRFNADHAPAALRLLKDVHAQVGAWPSEVRGCEVFRMPVSGLTLNCILHIYHWVVFDGPVAS